MSLKKQNLPHSLEDSVLQMFNAIEPVSVIPIAGHFESNETMILFQGRLQVIIYNDNIEIIEDVVLDKEMGNIGCYIPMEYDILVNLWK